MLQTTLLPFHPFYCLFLFIASPLFFVFPCKPGPTKRDSLVSYLPETATLLSVTSYFTKGSNNTSSAALDTTNTSTTNNAVEGGNSSTKVTSRSASPVPSRDHTASATAAAASIASVASSTAPSTATTTAPATTTTANAAPAAEAPSVLSSWGKKLTMFSSTSLETIKKGVASSVAAVSAVKEESAATAMHSAAATTGVAAAARYVQLAYSAFFACLSSEGC